ncbi:pterin-4-alpha-carbinolamine dehydratase [Dyadobacter luteus]|uniref:4a-hydroxytetrahydrobiopterin dehydratase n=1 Tax=Dyadobacter luteus TaxID=2259619 RepID=A0A3D8YC08_9BACT|nr:4a-hydroxytetrahydrobiopterin dehydratase [Dyadobacter luteus]REA61669.1 pterin-4-alpha-carbinolamine dehydratase [Dyadobacter luteus]
MWTEENDKLKRTFEFNDFKEAFAFMKKVAVVVDDMDHHPTWTNTYNKVEITLTTHDAGNKVTAKDKKLAEAIDQIFENK